MRSPILALAVLIVISLSLTNITFASIDDATLQKYVGIYNNKIDSAPDILKGLVGNEKIDLTITRTNGSLYVAGLETKNAHIDKVVKGGIDNPNININATEKAIDDIQSSKEPITAFQHEKDSGQVNIHSDDFFTNIKIGAVLSSGSILQFFYNMFFG